LEKQVDSAQKQAQMTAGDLKAENASLRALVNGKLTPMPEESDHIIIRCFPGGEFRIPELLGKIALQYNDLGYWKKCWYCEIKDDKQNE